ncbi:nucleoside-diphosphate-sugar epimerase [Paenarthrobacter nitroguajacolicus]|uniref:NAD-dependent epimerase/dehydratase family protein n=1 Tax=Paenarthrobacter nitroguajacolicus TaxID=211146 RepID=UPI0028608512|nr:NAD-dependent epimerase/dehydratase family protein [Paenarthrobacter nitroguajacolicus]MDR6988644.1 nucleoside-diphosphate-sugar epimerase [Paenarthrobacter nitroguajacolicus]
MTVVIAGCGDLGTEAGLRFAAAGHEVVGLRRSPEKLPAEIRGVYADLSNAVPELPADVDLVVVAVAADSSTEEAYRAAYVNGVKNVLDALERQSLEPRRILFVSSTAVYKDSGGAVVDETTPTEPTRFSGKVLVEAEDLLFARTLGTNTQPISLRLGGIYGPGRTRLIDQVRSGQAVIPAQPRHTNRVHRDDAAAMIVHLTTMDQDPEPVYVGVDDHAVEMGEVMRFLASELGCPEPPTAAPGGASDAGPGDKRCSNKRLRATGFEFTFPTYQEGYRALLAGEGVRHP